MSPASRRRSRLCFRITAETLGAFAPFHRFLARRGSMMAIRGLSMHGGGRPQSAVTLLLRRSWWHGVNH